MPASGMLGATAEPIVSSIGLLLVLTKAAQSHQRRPVEEVHRAARLLAVLVDRFVGSGLDRLSASGLAGLYNTKNSLDTLLLHSGYVAFHDAHSLPGRKHGRRAEQLFPFLQPPEHDHKVHLAAVLVELCHLALLPRQASDKDKQCFAGLLKSFAIRIDASRCASFWTEARHRDLPVLMAKRKTRRIHNELKRELVDEAGAAESISNVKQLMVAGRIWASKRRRADSGGRSGSISAASTGRWEWSVMFQYLVAGRRNLNGSGPICLALDGAKTAGEETMHTLAFSPVTKKCIWLPAQADFLGQISVRLPTISRADFSTAFFSEEIGAGAHAQIQRNRNFFAEKFGFLRGEIWADFALCIAWFGCFARFHRSEIGRFFAKNLRFLRLEFGVWVDTSLQ